MATKTIATLIATIWGFVQKEEETIPINFADMRTTEKDIGAAVFEMDGEMRISGEAGNNFSDFYVNYWDGANLAVELLFYLAGHGFEADWACPGYMVVEVKG